MDWYAINQANKNSVNFAPHPRRKDTSCGYAITLLHILGGRRRRMGIPSHCSTSWRKDTSCGYAITLLHILRGRTRRVGMPSHCSTSSEEGHVMWVCHHFFLLYLLFKILPLLNKRQWNLTSNNISLCWRIRPIIFVNKFWCLLLKLQVYLCLYVKQSYVWVQIFYIKLASTRILFSTKLYSFMLSFSWRYQ